MNGTQKAWAGAIVGAVIAFLTVLGGALSAGDTLGDVDTSTWILAIVAGLAALPLVGGTVYQTRNKIDGRPIVQELHRAPLAPEGSAEA